ncbi:MAG: adenylate/guanylate cyclase domain-containing protein [Acidimicrobiales bacterium]
MEAEQPDPDVDQLARIRSARAGAPDPAQVADVVRLALEAGATSDQVLNAPNLGELILDLELRPLGPETAGEVVTDVGVGWGEAAPFLRAIGIPVDPAERLTQGESDAIRLVVGGAREVLGDEATLQLARVMGNVAVRLAETLVAAFRLQVEVPHREAGTRDADVVHEYTRLALAMFPPFTRGLDALVRRQVLAAAAKMWSTDDEHSAVTVPRTVGFVDLVGYTERTATMTVRELTSVLMDFDRCTADVVANHGGSLVKTIGDEVLFSTEDPAEACRIALELIQVSGSAIPEVRIGMASGEMVSVFGDLYGPDVNLAARLVTATDPSTAIVSESVATSAPRFRFERLAPLDLKGLPVPVTAYRLLGPDETPANTD